MDSFDFVTGLKCASGYWFIDYFIIMMMIIVSMNDLSMWSEPLQYTSALDRITMKAD